MYCMYIYIISIILTLDVLDYRIYPIDSVETAMYAMCCLNTCFSELLGGLGGSGPHYEGPLAESPQQARAAP